MLQLPLAPKGCEPAPLVYVLGLCRLSDEPGTLGLSYCADVPSGPPSTDATAPAHANTNANTNANVNGDATTGATVRHELLAAAPLSELSLAAAVMALPHARFLLDIASGRTLPKVLAPTRATPLPPLFVPFCSHARLCISRLPTAGMQACTQSDGDDT